MLKKTVIMSVALVSIAAAALAHKGAGMSAMGQAVKSLTPMMRGQSTFDADAVRASADVMIMHAGEQMSRLFPEGSGGMPSSAMPAVWDEWDEFTALAAQLEVTAKGMKLGADNGLAAAQASGSASPSMEMVASMPTDMAFAAVVQTCSACHQQFRAEEN